MPDENLLTPEEQRAEETILSFLTTEPDRATLVNLAAHLRAPYFRVPKSIIGHDSYNTCIDAMTEYIESCAERIAQVDEKDNPHGN